MLPAVHLLIGVTLGIVLLYLTRDCRALVYCAVGSLLPDLFDKPLGHIVFAELGNGRIFFHSLTVCIAVALLGGILMWRRHHPGLLFVAAGMLSHQLADAMWTQPQSWYWPVFGGFPQKYNPNYFANMFDVEISSPSEILVIAGASVLILGLFQAWRTGNIRLFHRAAGVVGLLLLGAGIIVLSGFGAGLLPGFLIYSGVQDIAICGIALLCGGGAFILVSLSPPVGCTATDLL